MRLFLYRLSGPFGKARSLVGLCACLDLAIPCQTPASASSAAPPATPIRSGLEFSSRPSVQEITRARVFEEPLVWFGREPSADENADLATALLGYAKRGGPDDFASLTGYLAKHPQTPWNAALLVELGLEYYHTAHYSLALEAWSKAWSLARAATEVRGEGIADRAAGELAYMYARLGRMGELEGLLKAVEGRGLMGPAAQKIVAAREGLWSMKNRPDISFRCGPLALQCILRAINPQTPTEKEIFNSASTQQGFSLAQVAELSKKVGLNYQMAFREPGGAFAVPSVVHWKVGHYAALVRQEGDLYLLEDPTFGNQTWATSAALEAETSGYFLVSPGSLSKGWRRVDEKEGAAVWGKGQTSGNDDRCITRRDHRTSGPSCRGMAVPSVHLMAVNLNVNDEPLGYSPPVGPPVLLVMRYNHRESFQPTTFNYANFSYKWTCDWIGYITDNPSNVLADVNLYPPGGGERTFTGFDPGTQTFAPQQYDQTLLRRTGSASYELTSDDGSKLVFGQSDGSVGTTRKVFLTQIVDSAGNAVTLTYDSNLRLVSLTDAIGQVTTITYLSDNPNDSQSFYLIAKVTDPFGRFATFDYEAIGIPNGMQFIRLTKITDVIGLTSRFFYFDIVNGTQLLFTTQMTTLITPYGTNFFTLGDSGNTRLAITTYPDGSRERVEYNQTNNTYLSEPPGTVPAGMATQNSNLQFRNTYYWSRTACALGYGDYSKARVYHWQHTESLSTTAGTLESMRPPLEGRIWYDYPGGSPIVIGPSTRPAHVGRVLDDGSTQLYTTAYNSFGLVTNSVDPLGRRFSFNYDTNGIDLLEVRQTRGGNNELLFKATYNSQHRPLTSTDASGQTTTMTYNSRGQVLTRTNPKNETTRLTYDNNGYLIAVDGPLAGTNDTATLTYDSFGRIRTMTDLNGQTLTLEHDAMDRLTRAIHPDATFTQFTYDRLDCVAIQDRAGRQTSFAYDRNRRLNRQTDPLGRTVIYDWCTCGELKSIIDPMGRTTTWDRDVEGRITSKRYGDGSQVKYVYEQTMSRLREVIDEQQQVTFYTYNRDNTPKSVAYGNAVVATPGVQFTYDPDYKRVISMTDGTGLTVYSYNPITATPMPGAGGLASVDGPLPNDTITYGYDELGRQIQTAIGGDTMVTAYDPAGRIITRSNTLGAFTYSYDGSSGRLLSETFANGMVMTRVYADNQHERTLQQISYVAGVTPISQFTYARDIPRGRIMMWSQQAGAQAPNLFSFAYDAANQLLSATVTNSGSLVNTFVYSYDPAGNRLTEQVGSSTHDAHYNALNQISTMATGATRTNEWDAAHRLTAVNAGNQRTEFTYDGLSQLVAIRKLVNGAEVSRRRFIWRSGRICQERDSTGTTVVKRFYAQGFKLESGPLAGNFYYTRDHLGSIRELTDGVGSVRARYSYDPFGRATKLSGDVDADFGFAGMLWSAEAGLALAHFRAYDPELGRWLSRDPLPGAETLQGPNLYAYVGNEPVNRFDPEGLCTGSTLCACVANPANAAACTEAGIKITQKAQEVAPEVVDFVDSGGGAELPECGTALAENPPVQNFQSFSTQISQVEANPVSPTADTMIENTVRITQEQAAQLDQMDPLDAPPAWVWDRFQATLQIARDLHNLPFWDQLDPEEMKELWNLTLQWANRGDESDFWAGIDAFLNNPP